MAVEVGKYQNLFEYANNPARLWDARAEIPGLKSVMSLGKSNEILEQETQITRDKLFLELGDLTAKSVLEIGTGIGRFTGDLAKRASRVVSFDLSRKMLERTNQTAPAEVSLFQAAGQNLPLRDESIDTVFELTVLIHVVDDAIFRRLISEAMRVLKPGGKIVFGDPVALGQSVQKHPYLKYRTFSEYQDAAGVPLEHRGAAQLSNNSIDFLVGIKPTLPKASP